MPSRKDMPNYIPESDDLARVALDYIDPKIRPAMSVIDSQIRIRNERDRGIRTHDIPMVKSAIDSTPSGPLHIGEKSKNSRFYENFALPAVLIMDLSANDLAELISRPSKGRSRTRLFVYGPRISLFVTTSLYRALNRFFQVILIWGDNLDPDGYDPDEEFNLIPSDKKGECKPTLIIRPDDCPRKNISEQPYGILEELRGMYSQNPKVYFYWLPLQHDSNFPSDEHFLYSYNIEECFIRNLEKAAKHAANCLNKHDGKMNFNIIIQIKMKTIETGFLEHKSFRRFRRNIEQLDKDWEHVNGVKLSIQTI